MTRTPGDRAAARLTPWALGLSLASIVGGLACLAFKNKPGCYVALGRRRRRLGGRVGRALASSLTA